MESNYIFICEKWWFDLFFSSVLQIWYVEVWISRSISESPLGLEITRGDCIFVAVPAHAVCSVLFLFFLSIVQ